MNTTIKIILSLTLIASLLAAGVAAFLPTGTVSAETLTGRGGPGGAGASIGSGSGQGNTQNMGNGGMGSGMSGRSGMALTPLTSEESDALQQAILEEYGAFNLYKAVIAQFGVAVPFSQIAQAEQKHVNALIRQATKYGLSVPVDPGLKTKPKFTTFADACKAGVSAETADAALYDELISNTTHSDLLRVFQMLQSASLDSHLPAFEACS
jgi:hypothetical protein